MLARALERDGHNVTTAGTLADARTAVAAGVDLLVLDLGLPDGSGLELCRDLRRGESAVPILILTASTQVELRVQGLDAGADDYLTKPFALAELRARVRALGRRGPVSRSFFHVHNDVVLDFAGRRATRSNVEVPVTSREYLIAIASTICPTASVTISGFSLRIPTRIPLTSPTSTPTPTQARIPSTSLSLAPALTPTRRFPPREITPGVERSIPACMITSI